MPVPMRSLRAKAWFRTEHKNVSKAVEDCFRSLENDRKDISKLNVRHARLYGSRDIAGLGLTAGMAAGQRYTQQITQSTDNLIQSVCDTATALIAKDRPRARFMTDGAEFTEYQRAQLLEKFVFGVFQEVDVWDKAVDAFRDATIFGTGCLKVFAAGGRVAIERVLVDEVFVDELECMGGGMPRQLMHRKFVSRDVLCALFPEHEEAIENATEERLNVGARQSNPDLVEVIEAIHLPACRLDGDDEEEGEDPYELDEDERADWYPAHGGRRTIAIPGLELPLLDEEWLEPEFSYLFYTWTKLPVGFYGQGLAAELAPIQLQLNKLYRFVGRAHDLYAIPRIFLNRLSRINPHHLTNEIGAIVEYTGQPPVFLTPQAIGPEVYNWIDQLVARGYRRAGIGEDTAGAVKPAGVESGVAIREVTDRSSGRFIIQAQRFEDLIKHCARWTVKIGKQIAAEGDEYHSTWSGHTVSQRIKWSDVDLDDQSYVVKVEMSSILGMTPAGRLQSVMDLFSQGFIDKAEARQLLQHPDLEKSDDLANAAKKNIDKTAEQLLSGKWVTPWPFQDLAGGTKTIMQRALLADNMGAPPESLELCVRWTEQAKYLMQGPAPDPNVVAANEQAAAAAAPPAGALPPGMQPPGPMPGGMAQPPMPTMPPGPPPTLQ